MAKRKRKGKPQKAAPAEKPAAAKEGELLNMNQAIKLLKTTRPTFYRWLRAGKIKGHKVGRQWRFERGEIERFLRGEEPRIELRADITPLLGELQALAEKAGARTAALPEASPVLKACKLMLELGLAMRASDLHLETVQQAGGGGRTGRLRYRVDGVLHEAVAIDERLMPPIVEQWMKLPGCDPNARRPQDGVLSFDVEGELRGVNVRVSFMPTALGWAMTGRLLPATALIDFDRLGLSERDRDRLDRAINRPRGSIVVSAPTGAGKTTTIYACLARLAAKDLKIMTVEDPVEVLLPGVVQTAVSPSAGLTHATAARGMLRSATNVMFIGEVRNAEVLNLCLQASLTGHLVFTTLHTDDAATALVRMVEIGAAPFVVGDATELVVSQRLIRTLCPDCRRPAPLRGSDEMRAIEIARAGGLDRDALGKGFCQPVGCEACKGLGYAGLRPIAEALEVTGEIGAAVRRGAPAEEIRALAVGQGMTTMAADGLRRAAAGETTIDEVRRVLALAA
jgi:excisionase family DNA binding protein